MQIHNESLSVIRVVLLLRHCLDDTHFTVCNDNEAARWLLAMVNGMRKTSEWRLYLPEFDFGMVHTTGITHQAAIALSRHSTDENGRTLCNDELPASTIKSQYDQDVDANHKEGTATFQHKSINETYLPLIQELFAVNRIFNQQVTVFRHYGRSCNLTKKIMDASG